MSTHDRWRFQPEKVAPTAWLAPGAVVLGDVTIGEEASLWFYAVARGDSEKIVIGRETNVQDHCLLHADPGFPCRLGNRVTLGHGAIVHGATVGDDCLIGMRGVVMNGAQIGAGSIVGVGAVVTEGTIVPPGSLVLGVPGRVIRAVDERDRERIRHAAAHYVQAARECRVSLAAAPPPAAQTSGDDPRADR
jgi:carbonic anhydrase/acetyltransferase-like protein (isoleucine patch superfamily)